MNQYRIDRQTGTVHSYSPDHCAYIFLASFAALRVTTRSSDATIQRAAARWENDL